jgi:Tfp pilus assembly protein PilF
MQEYEDAVEEAPEDIESLKQLALSYHYQNFHDSALKSAEKLLELDPQSASAYNIMGAVAYNNRDIEAAQEHFEKAISLDPDLLAAHVNLGAIYNAMGEIEKSLAEYERALELDPTNAQVQKNLGDLYLTKREFDQALKHYRAYHEVRPKDPFVAYLGAKLIALSKDADPQEGHNMLNKLERATGLDVAMNEIRFALTTKRSEPNGDRLNSLIKTIPYLHDVLAVRTLLYERMEDLERAEETVRIALLMNMETAKKEAFEKRLDAYKRGEIPSAPLG